ncbi:MAG: disulfide bond formation protein B, partial [Parcubacteria group bacterium]
MIENITFLLPYAVLASHVILVILFFSLIFRNTWGKGIADWLGRHALAFAFAVSVAAIAGSLFYSEIVGFEPCVLCWWQRVFLYPLTIIFGVAIWKKNTFAFLYAVPLALIAAVIAAYQSYVQLGGTSLLPCTTLEGACSKIYVMAFDYITIPVMSLT